MTINSEHEFHRLNALKEYGILDSDFEEEYDEIIEIASEICDAPISLISLLDLHRQWFKAKKGLISRQTPREYAFCERVVQTKQYFEVENALEDVRYKYNPLVTDDPNIRFYAGAPLTTEDGYTLGTLCVIDRKPRRLSEQQKRHLEFLAKQVVHILELRKKNLHLHKAYEALHQKNEQLAKIVDAKTKDLEAVSSELDTLLYRSSHDLARPISSLLGLTQLASQAIDSAEAEVLCNAVKVTVQDMKNLVTKFQQLHQVMLPRPQAKEVTKEEFVKAIELAKLQVRERFPEAKFGISYEIKHGASLVVDYTFWQIIFANLLENVWMFRNKSQAKVPEVHLRVLSRASKMVVTVRDTGNGIHHSALPRVKDMFYRGSEESKGNGLGLYVVDRTVKSMGGEVEIESLYGKSTSIHIMIPFGGARNSN